MSKKVNVTNVSEVERRKHWHDRRDGGERRNPVRLHVSAEDCRSGVPRRDADVSGKLIDGAVWWNQEKTQYE